MENRIITAAQKNQAWAFEEIYRSYSAFVYTLAYRLTRNRDTAMDLSHDIFIKLFSIIKSFDLKSSFKTWLYRVTVNHVLNALQKEKNRLRILQENYESRSGVESREQNILQKDLLEKYLCRLDPVDGSLLILKYILGLSYHELTGIMDMPEGTLKTRVTRALSALRNSMQET
jgi:RNA polymerase sigma-70 factor (ECF subfamily)